MKKLLFFLLAVMTAATVFAAEETAIQPTTTEANYLWRDGSKIYQGDNLLSKQEYKNLLQNTCPEAFAQYKKGTTIANWGWGFLGAAGALMLGVAVPVLYAPNPHEAPEFMPGEDATKEEWNAYFTQINKKHAFGDAMVGTFFTMVGVSSLFVATSIPLISVGYSIRNKTLTTYNQQCLLQQPAITYSLIAGQNGIGFAINF